MRRAETIAPLDLRVEVAGGLPSGVCAEIREKITAATVHADEPVLAARVRLSRHADPAVARPVIAQANLDVNGRLVRVQVAAATAREAVDLLENRLSIRLERESLRWEVSHGGAAASGAGYAWRMRVEPGYRPEFCPQPPGDRKIIRYKAIVPARCTVSEAAAVMDALDYDFHLFIEAGTGQESVLYHAGPAGYRLVQARPDRRHLAAHTLPLTIDETLVSSLSTVDAADRLSRTGQWFVFFLDADRARGCVLYRRYDGHYGLIAPSG